MDGFRRDVKFALRTLVRAPSFTVVAVATPSTFPVIDTNLALVIGGLALVGSMALHEVFARRERDYATAQRFYSLQQAFMQLKEDVGLLRRCSLRPEEACEVGAGGEAARLGGAACPWRLVVPFG